MERVMRFALPVFQGAVTAHFSAAAADRVPDALVTYRGEGLGENPEIEHTETGPVLLAALLPDLDGDRAAELELEQVILRAFDGRIITMSPDDALAHPLLERWVMPSLGEMVSHAFVAGCAMANLAPGAPIFLPLEVRTGDAAELVAVWGLNFNAPGQDAVVQAFLQYGPGMPTYGLSTLRQVQGDAVFGVGVSTANPLMQPATPPQPTVDASAAAAFGAFAPLPHHGSTALH
jgi:hypothetical protein